MAKLIDFVKAKFTRKEGSGKNTKYFYDKPTNAGRDPKAGKTISKEQAEGRIMRTPSKKKSFESDPRKVFKELSSKKKNGNQMTDWMKRTGINPDSKYGKQLMERKGAGSVDVPKDDSWRAKPMSKEQADGRVSRENKKPFIPDIAEGMRENKRLGLAPKNKNRDPEYAKKKTAEWEKEMTPEQKAKKQKTLDTQKSDNTYDSLVKMVDEFNPEDKNRKEKLIEKKFNKDK